VWDTADPTAKPRHPDPEHTHWVQALAFRRDGRLFFRGRADMWFLYDPGADELVELGPNSKWIIPSPDAERAVYSFGSAVIDSWTIPGTGRPVDGFHLKCPGVTFLSAAFSPDGTTLATAELRRNQRVVAVRDADTAVVRRDLGAPASQIEQLAFSSDGTRLLGRALARVFCWDLTDTSASPRSGTNPGRKHFRAMAVHPAGPLLTVDNDRLVRVWDVPALSADRTIAWKIGKLHAVAVSPDGTRAAVGSHTGRVLVWDWD